MCVSDPTTATVLDPAVLRWHAEVENARRLSNRENGILGVIAMLLGLGLYRGPGVDGMESAWLRWASSILWMLSMLLMLVALGLVLWTRGSTSPGEGQVAEARSSFASVLLRWKGAPRLMHEVLLDAHEANLIAAAVTTEAARDLLRRNAERKRTLDRSQRCLYGSALCAGLVVLGYLLPRSGHRPGVGITWRQRWTNTPNRLRIALNCRRRTT